MQSKSHPILRFMALVQRLFKRLKPKSSSSLSKYQQKFLRHLSRHKLPSYEMALIRSIIHMNQITARDIMVPRVDVVTIGSTPSKSELQKHLQKTTYSRTPVYEDTIDNLKGIIHIRDIYKIMMDVHNPKKIDLLKYLSPPFYVPESRRVKDILKDLQDNRIHMAVVVDEYGGFSGIVTMEDILEEIIGDVQDEFDSEPKEIRKINGDSYSVDARVSLDLINQTFKLKLESKEMDTLGGFLIHLTGHIPKLNQTITYKNVLFKVIAKRRNSLTRIKIQFSNNAHSAHLPLLEDTPTSKKETNR